MDVGQRIRAAREAIGLQQNELAERAGLDQGTLNRIETGKSGSPRLGTVRRIATALGVSPALLLTQPVDEADLTAQLAIDDLGTDTPNLKSNPPLDEGESLVLDTLREMLSRLPQEERVRFLADTMLRLSRAVDGRSPRLPKPRAVGNS